MATQEEDKDNSYYTGPDDEFRALHTLPEQSNVLNPEATPTQQKLVKANHQEKYLGPRELRDTPQKLRLPRLPRDSQRFPKIFKATQNLKLPGILGVSPGNLGLDKFFLMTQGWKFKSTATGTGKFVPRMTRATSKTVSETASNDDDGPICGKPGPSRTTATSKAMSKTPSNDDNRLWGHGSSPVQHQVVK
ncbi:hypothetical protein C8R42DRAFT_646723 [Lentinula raphanica]|nr:hypothetical protein C8R42DRAFT_646723 [Lentinula raphanica]